MNNSLKLSLLFLLLISSLATFGQNTSSAEHSVELQSTPSSPVFYSHEINISSDIPTPFIMLSGYLEQEKYNVDIYYKTTVNGEWSDWQIFPLQEEGITPGRTVYFGGELDKNTTKIMLRSAQALPTNFKLRLFFPGHSSNNNASPRGDESDCSCAQPDICGRACWCPSSNCPIDPTPQPTVATHFIVHHSAGQTTSSDFAAVVRSYYDLHTVTNGWDDIGYNWLIDGNGIIYEGRGQGLQGAHFSCMNENTIGICVIGNYENATPTIEAIDALQNFIAWGACEEDIDVLGMDFHPSSTFNLNNISGHLDGNDSPNACSSTVCPGVNLYGLLPTIRDEIAAFPCLNDNPSSVNALRADEKIDLFPNPNNGKFQINLENVTVDQVKIYSSIGQELATPTFFNNITLPKNGLYHLQFRLTDGRIISKKVFVH